MSVPARPPLRRLADRLRAADPGFARARSVVRSLVAAGLGGGIAAGVLAAAGQPLLPAAIAVSVGLLGVLTLPPGLPRPWAPAAALGAATAAAVSALLGAGPLGYAAAMVVTVTAAWASRWGPVGVSAGFLAFITSLLSLRIGYAFGDIPGLLVAVIGGVAAVEVTVRVLLPDNPAATVRRLRASLLAQLSVLVDAVDHLADLGPGGGRQRRARLRLVDVQETALQLDVVIGVGASEKSAPEQRSGALRAAVLDAEALADHLLWAVLTLPPDLTRQDRDHLVQTLRRGRVELDEDGHPAGPLVPRLGGHDDRVQEVIERLAAAARRFRLAEIDLPTRSPRGTVPEPGSGRDVALKTGAAAIPTLLLGLAVAETEWYWGVIAAYIVVTTTTSRGEGFRKAVERLLGTVVGVVAGIGIAGLLAGSATLVTVALVGVLAAMIWVFRVNYTLFTFALTIAIALLYQVTGILTTEVMLLRVAETTIGVVTASLVVGIVRPVSSRRTVDEAVVTLLRALDDGLRQVQTTGGLATACLRAIDQTVSAVRQATAPFVTSLALATADGRAARLLATALRVRAAALATATRDDVVHPADLGALAHLRTRTAAVIAGIEREPQSADRPLDRSPLPPGQTDVGVILRAIDDRLAGYWTARDLDVRDDPGALAAGTGRAED